MIGLVPLLVCWGVHLIISVIMENLRFKLKTNMGKNHLNDDAITLRQFVPKTSQVVASNYFYLWRKLNVAEQILQKTFNILFSIK